ncbi:MDR family MFS transporter [Plantibacter sp. Mn2098]|uniref:MDR family MFS transporter n=1 Tax=Plantibacter sp. Mn2098 TaxID=3395266 RepID=UPI003BDCE61E
MAHTTTPTRPGTPTAAPTATYPGSGRVIGVLLVTAFVMILNETIMGVALPHLMRDFDITASVAQWLATGYMLTMAVVIPATGYLLNRFSIRPIALTAITLFTIGTLVAALAPGFGVLLLARILQAAGTAVMMPLLMTTILNVVPASRRGRTMGTISIVIAVAPAIGPTISGLILSSLSWRWMFWFVLPIAVAALILAAFNVRNVTTQRPSTLDVLSLVLSAFAFAGLIFGLSSIGESLQGHAPMPIWIPLTVGAVSLAAFIWRQLVLQRNNTALLDLRTFATPSFTFAVILVFVSMMALFGALIILPLYLQNVLQLSTLSTGLLMLPGGLVMAVLSPVVGALSDRIGAKRLVIPGTALIATALILFTLTLGEHTAAPLIAVLLAVLNAGLAFTLTPLLSSALGGLRPELYAHGSATISTLQQVAGATGTALFITLMTSTTTSRLTDGASALAAGAAGAHTSFLWGAMFAVAAVILACFLPRKKAAPATGGAGTTSGANGTKDEADAAPTSMPVH